MFVCKGKVRIFWTKKNENILSISLMTWMFREYSVKIHRIALETGKSWRTRCEVSIWRLSNREASDWYHQQSRWTVFVCDALETKWRWVRCAGCYQSSLAPLAHCVTQWYPLASVGALFSKCASECVSDISHLCKSCQGLRSFHQSNCIKKKVNIINLSTFELCATESVVVPSWPDDQLECEVRSPTKELWREGLQ